MHFVVGKRRISQFIETMALPHVVKADLAAAYRQMADDEAHEAEALEWAEATIRDTANAAVLGLVD